MRVPSEVGWVLYDGDCAFCTRSVRFGIRHCAAGVFKSTRCRRTGLRRRSGLLFGILQTAEPDVGQDGILQRVVNPLMRRLAIGAQLTKLPHKARR
jgi:hypothetical protein